MFGLGPTELIIIAVIILLLFGAKRLPDIGKGLGGAIREFRNVKKEISPEEPADKNQSGENASTLEAKVVDKVLKQVPGVKKAVEVKKKAEKVKEFIK
ncbi:MAG: twin-arginine translocase TatA/TatE family subunit [Deltaproteobacteria bacterium]|nr:twin-arginine translocase TatA/TatE family subunit [Deltaproteobacteria bacterium]MBW1738459.1 twin-arginine translocase TatA/TatE family subunit [Deltaproteobacteria bacterium]MBW2034118.1 twin-arginine translocase TatA/TatE family subunit [Deltaproteobacteria bacterium]MBW2115719.1 twin-arginine translocase TatA/TatE family subunit [Deltaproteobacteria bacterium]MBW2358900.1 twin-arginine translocase TatA/TatE family subunit [Deltaproteobacteria bacterium]